MTAEVIRVCPTPRPGDRFELRSHVGDVGLGRFVRVDSVYRTRTGRAMIVGVAESPPGAGEPITVEFNRGRQTGWRCEYGLSDLATARGRAEQWQRLVDAGELVHGDEDEATEGRGGAA